MVGAPLTIFLLLLTFSIGVAANDDGDMPYKESFSPAPIIVLVCILFILPCILIYLCRCASDNGAEEPPEETIDQPEGHTGLELTLLESIPTMEFRYLKETESMRETFTECSSVCLSDFEEEDVVHILPCNHIFHCNCIDVWFETNVTCPLCVSNIYSSLPVKYAL